MTNVETTDATGLGEIEVGAARINVDDKRMINARADVNQLLPMKYKWAGEVPGRLQQPLDADRGRHAGGHRAVEVAGRPHR